MFRFSSELATAFAPPTRKIRVTRKVREVKPVRLVGAFMFLFEAPYTRYEEFFGDANCHAQEFETGGLATDRPGGQITLNPIKFNFHRSDRVPSGVSMAQVCEICGKGPQFGNNISHAHNVTKRRWNVNLRPVHAKVKGGSKRIRVCTSCLRSGKVQKA